MACPFCQKGPVWYSHSPVKGFIRMLLLSPARYCFACNRHWHTDTMATMFMGLVLRPRVLLVISTFFIAYILTVLLSSSFDPLRWVARFRKLAERKTSSAASAADNNAVKMSSH